MTKRADIDTGRLIYSCNCGWLDLGHANPKSTRPFVGASSLWKQIKEESGAKSKYDSGFQVQYKQDMKGMGMTVGKHGNYLVKSNLSVVQKESVALAIFQQISMEFESMQNNWLFSMVTTSGFSVEDLVSNLLGFYRVVRPQNDYLKLCQPVSKAASKQVWDNNGAIGEIKNKNFTPQFFSCAECKKTPKFPPQLQVIKPTKIIKVPGPGNWEKPPPKLGSCDLVRRWSHWDSMGKDGVQGMKDLQEKWKGVHQD